MQVSARHNSQLGPLIVDVDGLHLSRADTELLIHPLVGGVILFSRNYENKAQLSELVAHIKSLRDPQLLVCVDQEGGRVQRFKNGFTELPPLNALGRLYDRDRQQGLYSSRMLARLMAHELKPLGIDFSFAPVVDLYDANSEVIANRAFHHNPQAVTELAGAYIQGLHDMGMIGVAKHYPGHGGVTEDSHSCLPRDQRCFKELNDSDLIPYRRLISNGLDAVMTAHVLFNHIDSLPSGFSPFWIKQMLREQLGFQGMIFTDDLTMQGAVEMGSVADRTQLALAAGCDMALICNDRSAVESVLDQPGLISFINSDDCLAQRCRAFTSTTPQLDSQKITDLLTTLGGGDN